MTGNIIATMPAVQALAETYGLAAEHLVHTFRTIAMPAPHTDAELVSCLLVAREHGLNPLTKEIYFMRDKHQRIQAIVGVDGWIRKSNEHAQFDGVEFDEREADGALISMTCRVFRKDRTRPTSVTEYFSECVQPERNGKKGPWQTHPRRMMRNRTLCQAYRLAFGFAGVMDPDEFEAWQMRDVTPGPAMIEPPVPPEPEVITDGVIEMTPAEAEHILFEIRNDVEGVTEPEIMAEHAENYAAVIATMPESYAAKARELLAPPSPPPAAEAQAPPPADHEQPVAAAGADIQAVADQLIELISRAPNKTRLGEISRRVDTAWPEAVKAPIRQAIMTAKARLAPVANGAGA